MMRRVTRIQKESRSGQGYLSHENCESPPSGSAKFPPRPWSARIWTRPADTTGTCSTSPRCGNTREATDHGADHGSASMRQTVVTNARSPDHGSPLNHFTQSIPAPTMPMPGAAGTPTPRNPQLVRRGRPLAFHPAPFIVREFDTDHDPRIARSTVPSPSAGSIPAHPPRTRSTSADRPAGRGHASSEPRKYRQEPNPHRQATPPQCSAP